MRDQGDIAAAAAEFRTTLEINPDFSSAHFNLGNTLWEVGKLDEALAEYQKVLDTRPDHVGAQLNMANILAQCGRVDAAIGHCQEVLRVQPNHAEARCNLAILLYQQGRVAEAIQTVAPRDPIAASTRPLARTAGLGVGHQSRALRAKCRGGRGPGRGGRKTHRRP